MYTVKINYECLHEFLKCKKYDVTIYCLLSYRSLMGLKIIFKQRFKAAGLARNKINENGKVRKHCITKETYIYLGLEKINLYNFCPKIL